MNFGSDNQTGGSKQVLEMLNKANNGFTHGYGEDEWTLKAIEKLKKVFEKNISVFFVATGTAANCLALSSMVNPWEKILCHHQSHIIMDESTGPEFYTGGSRLTGLAQNDPKLLKSHLEKYILKAPTDYPHNSRATAVSITQPNESGQVYSIKEVKEISSFAHKNNILLHMDGARFANALVSLNCTPAEITWKAGVDVLCLGATKCGALMAEAIIFFNEDLATNFIYKRKRAGHLVSKGRIFGSQFVGWLENNHWLELAKHANSKAKKFTDILNSKKEVQVVYPVKSNEIFVIIKQTTAKKLEDNGAEFYEWYEESLPKDKTLAKDEVYIRLVTSFLTTDEEIEKFCNLLV